MKREVQRMLAMLVYNLLLLRVSMAIHLASDYGYQDIVVRIDSGVGRDECRKMVNMLKILVQHSSSALQLGMGGGVYISRVTVVLPYRECGVGGRVQSDGYQAENILIVNSDTVFGTVPHTVQSDGCGEEGVKIIIPKLFLTNWNENEEVLKGKLLAREWAKYRYGVFDEFGFPGDLLYPNKFVKNGEILPTGTSNTRVTGTWISNNGTSACDPSKDDCLFLPSPTNTATTCSLGNLYFLPNVHGWCKTDQIKHPEGPTKQKVLCEGKTAEEVIFSHQDLKLLRSAAKQPQLLSVKMPTFDMVYQSRPRYVFVMQAMQDMEREWKWMRKCVQYAVKYVLTDGAEVSIVTYSSHHRVEHGLSVLTDGRVRWSVADSLPDRLHTLGSGVCVVCGVRGAVRELGRSREEGAELILLRRGDELSEEEKKEIKDISDSHGVKISSIEITQKGKHWTPLPLGKNVQVEITSNQMVFFKDLIVAMIKLVKENAEDTFPEIIKVKSEKENNDQKTRGRFIIDNYLGQDTVFAVLVEDEENHGIKSIQFESEDGQSFGPYFKMSSLYNLVNMKTINFKMGEAPPFDTVSPKKK